MDFRSFGTFSPLIHRLLWQLAHRHSGERLIIGYFTSDIARLTFVYSRSQGFKSFDNIRFARCGAVKDFSSVFGLPKWRIVDLNFFKRGKNLGALLISLISKPRENKQRQQEYHRQLLTSAVSNKISANYQHLQQCVLGGKIQDQLIINTCSGLCLGSIERRAPKSALFLACRFFFWCALFFLF